MGRIHLGTSGFVYKDWRGLFYPRTLPAREWLDYYARVFSTVELNNTFYRLPNPDAVKRWRKETPSTFEFVAKGSRFITHMKRLKDPKVAVARYFEAIRGLGPKLTAVLWQLPPQMTRPEPDRLDAFLRALPKRHRYIVEFRHDAWHTEEICAVLDAHGAAICEHDLVKTPVPRPTGNFRYLRFHGSQGKYKGRYGAKRLRRYAEDLKQWSRAGKDAFVFFNNDRQGQAILDALTLSDLLGQHTHLPNDVPAFAREHTGHERAAGPKAH